MLVPDDEICFSCVNANTADDVRAPDGAGRDPLPARLTRPSDRSARSPRATVNGHQDLPKGGQLTSP